MVALLLYPKVQERIHEEIDRVIGCERLPTWNDRESLPYLEAVRKEVIRWNPVTGYSESDPSGLFVFG
jgi:cytochrome P450